MFRFTEITSDDEMNETAEIKEDNVDLDINEGNANYGKYIISNHNCFNLIRNTISFDQKMTEL